MKRETHSQPARVAFIAGQLSLGGAEQQLYYLVSGLDRSCYRPLVIHLGPSEEEYWKGPLLERGVPVEHVPRSLGRAMRALRIASILRHENVDIVHAWMFHTNPYAALAGKLAGVPVRLGSMREAYGGLPRKRFLRSAGFYGLDALVTNSARNARAVQELGVAGSGVQWVPNGVPIPQPAEEADRRHLKAELGCPQDGLLMGTIGRLDENKNHAMLIRVFARLAGLWPSLSLAIVGDGPLRSRLRDLAAELGVGPRVHLHGAVPQAKRFLSAMDVCCLSSYTEGAPNLVMEACAAGVPVVATSCGDTGDLIEQGVSGYLVAADDDGAMAERVRELLANPERRLSMGRAGRSRMKSEYSVEAMVSRMARIYENLLARRVRAHA